MKPQTKNALRVHVGLVLAEAICISAFFVEISRALGGNTLSWAYVFEWPILGIYAVFMWRRLLHADDDDGCATAPPLSSEDERRLNDYNDFLTRVHRSEKDARQRDER